jgi:zinc D-Ala-D-Ala carboxypeptidase
MTAHDTANFRVMEFACKCGRFECRHIWVDQRLIDALQELRELVGYPIIVNSGCRCVYWNKVQGGVRNSQHIKGTAADIRCDELSTKELAAAAEMIPAFKNGGIGTYPTWVHVDVRGVCKRWHGK